MAQKVVQLGLEALRQQQQQSQEALERLNQRRLEYHRINGMYAGDLIAEVRAEREKQIDRVMRGK